MENRRWIIVDIYQLTDEEMKEEKLLYKNRAKAYDYRTEKIIDFAVPNDLLENYEIGKIIYNK